MSSLLLTAPAIEPLSLAEAKAFLRVETSDDDDVICALIAGSRIHVEAQTRRALITQSWRISADVWPDDGRRTLSQALRQAARLLVAHWYENRGLVTVGTATVLPQSVAALIAPYRMLSL